MDNVLIILIVLPLLFGVAIMTVCRTLHGHRGYSILACLLNLFTALYLVRRTSSGEVLMLRLGNWPSHYGIVLIADLMSACLIFVATFIALLITMFAQRGLQERRERRFFHPLTQFLVMGVNMSFLAGDLFNLFVSFEVMLIASYALLSLGAARYEMKPVYLYLCLNILAGVVFLFAVGLTYGLLGTLNLAELGHRVAMLPPEQHGRLLVIVLLLLFVFGCKAAMFPLFFWLPHSYGVVATPIVALFAGMLTKVGVYAMIRVLAGPFAPVFVQLQPLLLVLACATMLLGVIGAVAQDTIRRVLSFHIISQIGYMVMGVAFFTEGAFAATLFFMMHNMIVKTGLLLVGGIVELRRGTDRLSKLGGFWASDPVLGIVFLLLAFSLAGLPPFTGFWGKLMLIREGLSGEFYLTIGVAMITSVLTTFSMLKIWMAVFWRSKPAKDSDSPGMSAARRLRPPGPNQWVAAGALCLFATIFGILPETAISVCNTAGREVATLRNYYDLVVVGSAPLTEISESDASASAGVDPWRGGTLFDPQVDRAARNSQEAARRQLDDEYAGAKRNAPIPVVTFQPEESPQSPAEPPPPPPIDKSDRKSE